MKGIKAMQRTDLLGYRYKIDTNWTVDVVLEQNGYDLWLQHDETYVKMWMRTVYYEYVDDDAHLEAYIKDSFDLYKEVYLYNTRE